MSILSSEQYSVLRAAMLDTYFQGYDPAFIESKEGQRALWEVIEYRYAEAKRALIPWIARHVPLAGATAIEFACSTGSRTAALAERCARVIALDIDPRGMKAAEARIRALNLQNVQFALRPAHALLSAARELVPDGAQLILLHGLLEHQRHEERQATLKGCWALLRSGGVLVVADSPNRLTYGDYHTSFLPFFHQLPHEVAIDYARFSPRTNLASDMARDKARSYAAAEESLVRWGRGISYHDFELALGDLSGLVVGDGFDSEILSYKSYVLEEELLERYVNEKQIKVPRGFLRQSVDVILRKP